MPEHETSRLDGRWAVGTEDSNVSHYFLAIPKGVGALCGMVRTTDHLLRNGGAEHERCERCMLVLTLVGREAA